MADGPAPRRRSPAGDDVVRPDQTMKDMVAGILRESRHGMMTAPQVYRAIEAKYVDAHGAWIRLGKWRSTARSALSSSRDIIVRCFVRDDDADGLTKGHFWMLRESPNAFHPLVEIVPEKKKAARSAASSSSSSSSPSSSSSTTTHRKRRASDDDGGDDDNDDCYVSATDASSVTSGAESPFADVSMPLTPLRLQQLAQPQLSSEKTELKSKKRSSKRRKKKKKKKTDSEQEKEGNEEDAMITLSATPTPTPTPLIADLSFLAMAASPQTGPRESGGVDTDSGHLMAMESPLRRYAVCGGAASPFPHDDPHGDARLNQFVPISARQLEQAFASSPHADKLHGRHDRRGHRLAADRHPQQEDDELDLDLPSPSPVMSQPPALPAKLDVRAPLDPLFPELLFASFGGDEETY